MAENWAAKGEPYAYSRLPLTRQFVQAIFKAVLNMSKRGMLEKVRSVFGRV